MIYCVNLIYEFSNFNNKKVLITGHTGFKGLWLSICLLNLGAKIIGISLKPNIFQKSTEQVKK